MKLDKIENRPISIKHFIKKKVPIKKEITSVQIGGGGSVPIQFEIDALNFLFNNSKDLNIDRLYALRNSLIDCYLTTFSGKNIAVEFKYALNWNKSNVARSQIINFRNYQTYGKLDLLIPDFGIIIFSDFSNDWKRLDGGRDIENGWLRFYEEQKGYDGFVNIHIFQLTEKHLRNPGFE